MISHAERSFQTRGSGQQMHSTVHDLETNYMWKLYTHYFTVRENFCEINYLAVFCFNFMFILYLNLRHLFRSLSILYGSEQINFIITEVFWKHIDEYLVKLKFLYKQVKTFYHFLSNLTIDLNNKFSNVKLINRIFLITHFLKIL